MNYNTNQMAGSIRTPAGKELVWAKVTSSSMRVQTLPFLAFGHITGIDDRTVTVEVDATSSATESGAVLRRATSATRIFAFCCLFVARSWHRSRELTIWLVCLIP